MKKAHYPIYVNFAKADKRSGEKNVAKKQLESKKRLAKEVKKAFGIDLSKLIEKEEKKIK